MTQVEIAIDDVSGGAIAEGAGADRIELCGALADGGTTPSIGLVRTVTDALCTASLRVLIRPRAGDFVYTPDELRTMTADIAAVRTIAPEAGFVIGALEPSGVIDEAVIEILLGACAGAPVTFHKAFDSTPELIRSLDTLIGLGVQSVLSSGGRRTALEGATVLRGMVEHAAGRITVIAGGSVRADNVAQLVSLSNVPEVHLRAPALRQTASLWSNPEQNYDSANVSVTDGGVVRAVVAALAGAAA